MDMLDSVALSLSISLFFVYVLGKVTYSFYCGALALIATYLTFSYIREGNIAMSTFCGVAAIGWAWLWWNDDDTRKRRKKALKLLGDKSRAVRDKLLKSLKPPVVLRPVPQSV